MRDYEEKQRFMKTLNFEEILNVHGGVNWPFADLISILQGIQVGEDLVLGNIIQVKK